MGATLGEADGVGVADGVGEGDADGETDGSIDILGATLGEGEAVGDIDWIAEALGIADADAIGFADGGADENGDWVALTAKAGKTGAAALELPVPQPVAIKQQDSNAIEPVIRSIVTISSS